jgi:uncharacterized protein (DUF427 family)
MSQPAPRIHGPGHSIVITKAPNRVRVVWRGKVIADTTNALDLKEAGYPVVKYVPRADADMSLLEKTDHRSHCPYKGDAGYFSITVDGATSKNAVWTYEHPKEAVAAIKDHLAFYPDRVGAIEDLQSPSSPSPA